MSEFDYIEVTGSMQDAGDVEMRQFLIEAGIKVDSLEEEEPLHRAASNGMYERAALLINSKCDINLKDRYGRTPVMLAAKRGRKDIVDLLLHRGAQLNCIDDDGCTLLHHAASGGCTGIGRLILDNGGVDLNCRTTSSDMGWSTPLILAIKEDEEEFAVLLIRAGADVSIRDYFKATALHYAADGGHTRVMQILLEKEGLDLNPQDISGNTPLHDACAKRHHEIIKLLLDAGADTNLRNKRGETALNILFGGLDITHEEIRLFVQKGAFFDDCDYECISQDPFLKENVLKDVELCTQSAMNKFNRQSLPALNSFA